MRAAVVAFAFFGFAMMAMAMPVDLDPLSDEFINYINGAQSHFHAKKSSRFETVEQATRLLGAWKTPASLRLPQKTVEVDAQAIPDTFDSATAWPNCASIKDIRDQSDCGSCWAVSAAEAMSDRICVATNGTLQTRISGNDLMACCGSCGNGCGGGYPDAAWDYFKNTGIVTGWNYNTTGFCKSYPFPPCAHHVQSPDYPPCPSSEYPTPKCDRTCDAGYPTTYNSDLKRGKSSYSISRNVAEIQTEIMTHGPVQASFNVYADFLTYTSGVYKHTSGSLLGGHAVKIVGWGVSNGTPYWRIANSWNPSWGDNGYFNIVRGSNECGIENDISAGLPQ